MLCLAFVYSAKLHMDMPAGGTFLHVFTNVFFLAYFVVATLVLSLGGRLYFLSGLLMLVVYRSVYFRKIHLLPLATFFILVLCFVGTLGVMRMGESVAFEEGMVNVFVEPLFNAYSLIAFLGDSGNPDIFQAVAFPHNLLESLYNLLPTIITGEKPDSLESLLTTGFVIYSPGGSFSSYVSFMINFGFVGTAVCFFLAGFGLTVLRIRADYLLARVVYVMVSGWLAFTFFRDPFSVSLVKAILQFSILTPIVIVLTAHVMSSRVHLQTRSRPHRARPRLPVRRLVRA
jgi:hypothetical protein